ncbi:hypothetical protein Hanom_Chr03g00236561 [Helianthus anomalus]
MEEWVKRKGSDALSFGDNGGMKTYSRERRVMRETWWRWTDDVELYFRSRGR